MALTRPRLGQLNTSIVAQADPITVLNQGASSANVDVGFLFNRANGLVSNVALYWSESAQSIVTAYTSSTGSTNSNISVTSYANLTVGNVLTVNGGIIGIVGNLTLGNLIANTGVYAVSSVVSGNVSAGNVLASGFFYANGSPFVSSSYGNVQMLANLAAGSNPVTFGSNIITGNILPNANVTYDIGSPTLRFRTLYISGTTIDMGGAQITTDSASGGFAFVPKPTTANPNPLGTVFSPGGGITTINTTGGTIAAGAINTSIENFQGTAKFGNVRLNSEASSTSTTTGALVVTGGAGIAGNVFAGNVLATGFFYANGTPFVSSSYGNTDVASYLPTYTGSLAASTDITALYANAGAQSNSIAGANAAIITANTALKAYTDAQITTANTALKNYVDTGNTTQSNQITAIQSAVTGANAAIVTANTAIKSYVDAQFTNLTNGAPALLDTLGEIATSLGNNASLSTTLLNSIAGSNAAIITANTALKSYVDTQDSAITTAWTSNAGAQANQIAGANAVVATLQANVGSFYTYANATFIYGNANVAANLATFGSNPILTTGNVTAANVYSTGVYVGSGSATSGLFWSANSAVINPGITYTASTNPPDYPTRGDQWYNTSTDVFYEYITDGTSSYWIDIVSTVVSSGATGATGPAGPAGTIANTASWIVTTNTTTSTSTTTGALQVAGGAGIAGNVFAGNVLATGFFYSNGTPFVSGGSSSSVTVTTIAPPGTQTAVDIAGGETITATGSGFNAGITAYIIGANTVTCTTTYTNSTSASFTTNAISAGTYSVILYNTDGTNGIKPGGITYSSPPIWVTAAGTFTAGVKDTAYSQSVSATGAGITYGVTSGALPTGLSLNSSSGVISGTPTVANTFNFTITATNNYNQTTARAFSIIVSSIIPTDTLVIAGGGSGGTGYYGGGGGAGGYLESTSNLSPEVTYTITVATGGVGTTVQANRGGNGGNSSISGSGFTSIIAIGGGGGGSRNNDQNSAGAQGAPGGSGGGASYVTNAGGKGVYPGSTFLSQARQGYDGGSTNNDSTFSAGGGGAGAPGNGFGGTPPRSGGTGLASSITGTSVTRGGGGGNAIGTSYPGAGGGGAQNTAGTANTGGGGGGGSGNNAQGGNGGSGVVIIKYADTFAAATVTGSPTITSITGFRIYTFTGTGTFNIPS